jgi:hypothetical protein
MDGVSFGDAFRPHFFKAGCKTLPALFFTTTLPPVSPISDSIRICS